MSYQWFKDTGLPQSFWLSLVIVFFGNWTVFEVSAQQSPSQLRASQAEARLKEMERQIYHERQRRLEVEIEMKQVRREAEARTRLHEEMASNFDAERRRRTEAENLAIQLQQEMNRERPRLAEPKGQHSMGSNTAPQQTSRFEITGFTLNANAPDALKAALPKLIAPYLGKNRNFEDLSKVTSDVNLFLQNELGYFLAYSYIPEQESADGVIRLAVLEGRLEQVELEWSGDIPFRREWVERYLSELQPGAVLLTRHVERVQRRINGLHGIVTEFEFVPGRTPGLAKILVVKSRELINPL